MVKKAYSKVDLCQFFNMTSEANLNKKFVQFVSYQTKSMQTFIVLDSSDNFLVLDQELNLKNLIRIGGAESQAAEQEGGPQVTSFARQGSALVFTKKNQIGFLQAQEGKLGPVMCAVSHDIELTAVQTDYSSSIFMYGLAPKTQEIYVFRTSNLLSTPVALTCDVETKIPLLKSPLSDDPSVVMSMQNVKGGLLVDISTDTMEGELQYYNVTQFTHKRHEERPVYREVESVLIREAIPVTTASTKGDFTPRRKFSETSTGINGNLIIVKSNQHPDRLLMYEFAMPYLDRTSSGVLETLASEEARIPLVLIFVGGTLYYHLFYKQGAYFGKTQARGHSTGG